MLKLVIAVFAVIFMLIVGPIRIGEGAGTLEAIATSAMNLWIYVWIPIGIVTVVFAAVERAQQRDAGYGWNPRSLPGVGNVSLIPRSESIAQAAFGTIFVLWWASGAPMLPAGDAASVQHSMLRLFVPVLFVALCSVALGVANALHPYWSRLRLALRVGIDALTAAIALWIVSACWSGIVVDASQLNHPQLLSAGQWTNLSLALGLAVTAVIAAISCVAYAVRLVRLVRVARMPLQKAFEERLVFERSALSEAHDDGVERRHEIERLAARTARVCRHREGARGGASHHPRP